MIDAHCHLQQFGERADEVLAEAVSRGIGTIVVNGTSEADWDSVAVLARKYPQVVIPFFGYHPWFIGQRSDEWRSGLNDFLDEFPAAGIGEIGVDRWMQDPDVESQKRLFREQWQLAAQRDRPVTVHCLKAWGILLDLLDEVERRPFLLHSYSGSQEMVSRLQQRDAYFSISGYFLRPEKHDKLEVFRSVAPDRLLLETDAPEMALPETLNEYSGWEENHPANLAVIYREVAAFLDLDETELVDRVKGNFRRFTGCRVQSAS